MQVQILSEGVDLEPKKQVLVRWLVSMVHKGSSPRHIIKSVVEELLS